MRFGKLTVILAMAGISVSLCACGHKEQPAEDNKVETSDLFEKIGSEKEGAGDVSDSGATEAQTQEQVADSEDSVETTDANVKDQTGAAEETVTDQTVEGQSEPAETDVAEGEPEVQVTTVTENIAENAAPANGITVSYDLNTLQNMHYSDEQMEQIRQFYNGAVFAGDSVLLGFRNYSAKSSDPMLTQLQFLAAGSLSLHNAFWEVSDKSVHPLYQGAQHPIWESMQMMGASKAFLFFGINDVSYDLEESVALYPQLIDKIRELSPNMEITIISATYTLKDMGKGRLNNTNIAAFNASVKALAEQNGWGYIDMATVLSDGAGNLAPEYCSDGFLHESKAAYNVWTQMLVRYAAERLGLQETPVDATAQETPENNG